MSRDYTWDLNGEIGYGNGLKGGPLPFYKNFYAGGVNSVRAYDTNSLGPRDIFGNIEGGIFRTVANAELYVPMPGLGLDRSVRLGLFVDGGNVFGAGQNFNFSALRYSTGLSVTWYSPVGPMKVSFGYPINSEPGDRIQRFQFLLGNTF